MLNKVLLTVSVAMLPFCAGAQLPVTTKGLNTALSNKKTHTMTLADHLAHMRQQATSHNRMGAKTTADASRLIALAYKEHNGTTYDPTDSAVLSYSGTRGSLYQGLEDGWVIKCDNGLGYAYDLPSSSYRNNFKFIQTFDASNNISTYIDQEWNTGTSAWDNVYKNTFTYNTSNQVLTNIEEDWDISSGAWVNYSKQTNSYNAGGKVDTELIALWNTGSAAWENEYRYVNSYDASYNLTLSVLQIWNVSTSSWEGVYKMTNTYDAAGNELTSIGEGWDMALAAWENYFKNTSTYDGMNRRLTRETQLWDSAGAVWENSNMSLFSNFSGMHPGMAVYQNWNGTAYENSYRDSITYNSFSQPVYDYMHNWNPGTSAWEAQTGTFVSHYYYETYTTALKNIAKNGTARIYPIPAKNTISVDVAWAEQQEFTISILDIQGRVHSAWSVPSCTHHTEAIPVGNLPAGNYFIKMKGPKGELAQKITIEK
jgi:hypothetical protein